MITTWHSFTCVDLVNNTGQENTSNIHFSLSQASEPCAYGEGEAEGEHGNVFDLTIDGLRGVIS